MSSLCEQKQVIESNETKLVNVKQKDKQTSQNNGCINSETMSASITSSLASPGDSGVQLLDSESDLASIMSMSGQDFTFNDTPLQLPDDDQSPMNDHRISVILNSNFQILSSSKDIKLLTNDECTTPINITMTTSDIVNQNTTPPSYECKQYSQSVPADGSTKFLVTSDDKLKLQLNKDTGAENSVEIPLKLMSKMNKSIRYAQYFDDNSSDSDEVAKNSTSECLNKKEKDEDTENIINKDDIMQTSIILPLKTNNSINYAQYFDGNSMNNLNKSQLDDMDKFLLTSNDENDISDEINQSTDQTNYSLKTDENADKATENSTENKHIIDKDDVMQTSILTPMVDEQIVFRRQRRKKVKSQDTPKKRVSFHEDILNSTKIDDIHIDRGFITRAPNDLKSRNGIVVGRYSWAAEGDSQYYESHGAPERQVHSDIIYGNTYNSTSSSSSISLDSANSSDDSPVDEYNGFINGIQNIKKVPKSSCLKKPKHGRNYIDTKIVQEESPQTSRRNLSRKISESNILDTNNLFGSLKNIYKTLSSSVPLAERGVPEGQEDFTMHSSAENLCRSKRSSFCNSGDTLFSKSYDGTPINIQVVCEPEEEVVHSVQIYKKPNLRLSRSEGFYPNYPTNQNQPDNIILCDSNVYEHRGISYSYEYDQFQNAFNRDTTKAKGGLTLYQMLLDELNFLKRSEKQPKTKSNNSQQSSPKKKVDQLPGKKNSTTSEWSSDTESISDASEKPQSRHLQSPLRKRTVKSNHYSISNKMYENDSENLSDISSVSHSEKMILKPASSKTSLINRFLRNITQRKIMDSKLRGPIKSVKNNYLSFYLKNVKPDIELAVELDNEIESEINNYHLNWYDEKAVDCHKIQERINNKIFKDNEETLLDVFKIKSAYDKNGENRAMLLLLTNTTLYVTTTNRNQMYYNEFLIPYKELHYILIGPNSHTVYISNRNKTLEYFITTGDGDLTSQIIGRIEYAMRKDNCQQLPAIKELTLQDMHQMRLAVFKQTPVTKEEDFHHYSLINIQEDQLSPLTTPLGPFREGFLMYRKAQTDERWQFAYFILKGGVLYTLSSPTCRIPIKVMQLQGGACQGAHRTLPKPRPHTFELLTSSECLEFAASDEYEASDWLQALVQSASGMQNIDEISQTKCCTLVLTTDHLVTLRENFDLKNLTDITDLSESIDVLSYAAISDLIAFKVPLVEQSWCVLEFSCREVQETSGDWILYFASNYELDKFLSVLELLWSYTNSQGDSFPLTTVPETEMLNRQASETYQVLQQAWVAFQ